MQRHSLSKLDAGLSGGHLLLLTLSIDSAKCQLNLDITLSRFGWAVWVYSNSSLVNQGQIYNQDCIRSVPVMAPRAGCTEENIRGKPFQDIDMTMMASVSCPECLLLTFLQASAHLANKWMVVP